MRKLFIAIISAITMLTACFAGCSCIGSSPISFNSNFYGSEASLDPPAGYKETLTYNVVYKEKISEELCKSPFLNNVNYSFSDGVYVSTLETVTSLPESITSDIIEGLPSDAKTLYKLTTKLSILSTYVGLDQGSGEYLDTIESTVYFCSYRLSFAPIYSTIKTDYSMLFVSDYATSVDKLVSERTFNYSKTSYKLTETVKDNVTVSDYEYDFTTIIDNAQLLFAFRNITVPKDSFFYLPTVSYAFGSAKNLKIDIDSQTTEPVNITYNGVTIADNISLNNYSFMINDSKKAGIPQYVSVQSAKSDNLPYTSLLYSYVEPLVEYGSMLNMGYLSYTLSSVEIVQ
ncbi:MAG: hypothetical protein IKA12_04840 [Clostridia bacterium]|nr:hypothetical protein [Clostridia bacterium]